MTYDPFDETDVLYRSIAPSARFNCVHHIPDELSTSTTGGGSVSTAADGARVNPGTTTGDTAVLNYSDEFISMNGFPYEERHLWLWFGIDDQNENWTNNDTPSTDVLNVGFGADPGGGRGVYVDYKNEQFVDNDASSTVAFDSSVSVRNGITLHLVVDAQNNETVVRVSGAGLSQKATFNNMRDRTQALVYTESNGGGNQVVLNRVIDAIVPKTQVQYE